MNKGKRSFLLIITLLTLIFSSIALIYGTSMHADYIAEENVAKKTAERTDENTRLASRRDILKNDVGSKTDDTDRKNELNKEITEITGEIETMKTDIDTAKNSVPEVKSRTEDARNTLNALNAGMNLSRGEAVPMEENGILSCPESIKPGRYIAEGDGLLTIFAAAGSARVSEDLLTIDTGTYIFDLAEGERVEAQSGKITLTELK